MRMVATTETPRVFFLYSLADEAKVREVVSMAQRDGIQPWANFTHVCFGEDMMQRLGEAVEQHSHAVIFVTPNLLADEVNRALAREFLVTHPECTLLQLLYDGSSPLPLTQRFKPVGHAERRPAAEIATVIRRALSGHPIAHGCEVEVEQLPLVGAALHGIELVVLKSEAKLSDTQLRSLLRRSEQDKICADAPTLIVLPHEALENEYGEVGMLIQDFLPGNTAVIASFSNMMWNCTSGYPDCEPGGEHAQTCTATVVWAKQTYYSPLYQHVRSHLGQTPDLGPESVRYPLQPVFQTIDGMQIGLLGVTCEDNDYSDTTRMLVGAYTCAASVANLTPTLAVSITAEKGTEKAAVDRLLQCPMGASQSKFVLAPALGLMQTERGDAAFAAPCCEDGVYRILLTPTGVDIDLARFQPLKQRGFGPATPMLPWSRVYRQALKRNASVPEYHDSIRKALLAKRVRVRQKLVGAADEATRRELLVILDPTVTDPESHYRQSEALGRIGALWRALAKTELAGPVQLSGGSLCSAWWGPGESIVVLAGRDGGLAQSCLEDFLSRLNDVRPDEGLNPFESVFAIVLDGLAPAGINEYSAAGLDGGPTAKVPGQVYFCTFSGLQTELLSTAKPDEFRARLRRVI